MPQYTYPDDFEGTFWSVVDGDYYVSTIGNDISGDGSPKKPFLTVAKAFDLALDGEKIIIGPDEYVSYKPTDVSPSGAHLPCRVASVGNFVVGAGGGGEVQLDGIQTTSGDRVLVWQQTDPKENGIYVVGAGVWERAGDFNSLSDIVSGKLIPVLEGTENGKKAFQHITQGNITIDVTPIVIEKATVTDWGEIEGLLTDQVDISNALNLKANDADLTNHIGDSGNPHGVTKGQVGLGNADNTSDADKPISTAQQTALDAKADDSDLVAHTSDSGNPHSVTKGQIGLGNVNNTSDADKPISTAQQTALNAKADDSDLLAHTSHIGNPHGVTKSQVGLGSVNNTSDASKPISTAQQSALNTKADKANVLALDNTTSFTPSSNYHPATKKFVEDQIATLDKATPKGLLDCSSNPNYPSGKVGDYYYVSVAGKVGGSSGEAVQVGDKIQCIINGAAGTQASVGSNWIVFQGNLDKVTTSQIQAGTNDEKYVTAAKAYSGWYSWLNNKVVSELSTTSQTIVGAINEVDSALGTHVHAWGSITGKPSTFAPSSHSHAWSTITGKPSTFAPSSHSHAWGAITGKPTTFSPSTHSHSEYLPKTGGTISGALTVSGELRLNGVGLSFGFGGDNYEMTFGDDNPTWNGAAAGATVNWKGDNSNYNLGHYADFYHAAHHVQAVNGFYIGGVAANGTQVIDASGNFLGNAATASKWASARTISLAGDVTGSASIDGASNVTITTAYADDGTFLRANANDIKSSGYLRMNDNLELQFGTGGDFRIDFNGTDTIFRNYAHAGGDVFFQGENSAGTNQNVLKLDHSGTRTYAVLYENSVEKLRTVSGGVQVTGNFIGNATSASKWAAPRTISLVGDVTGSASMDGASNVTIATAYADDGTFLRANANDIKSSGYLRMNDNLELQFGTGGDFRIDFNGTDTIFRSYAHAGGDILFQGEDSGGTNENLMILDTSGTAGYVRLYQGGNEKMRTIGDGVEVFGNVYVPSQIIHTGDTNTYIQFHANDQWRVVTAGVEQLEVGNSYLEIPNLIRHTGDTDTYMQFNAANSWRVVTGNAQRILVNSSGLTVANELYVPNKVIHVGDTDTYTQFHAADQWRVVTSGAERLEVNNSEIFASRALRLNSGYNLRRSNHHSGHLEGSYNNVAANSTKSNPIYTIGSSYNPSDAALGNMYGIGYSHTNASFVGLTQGGAGWGMYVAATGVARIFLNGTTGIGIATDWIAISDERLKTNIRPFGSVLDKIAALKGSLSSYNWKENGVFDVGFTAQKVQKQFPDFVQGDEMLGVSYGKLSAVAIEGVAEVNEELTSLRREVELLKSQLKKFAS